MNQSKFDRLAQLVGRSTTRRAAVAGSASALMFGLLERYGAAQESTPVPGASPQAVEDFDVLFVQSFAYGSTTPSENGSFSISLAGGTGQTVYFSNRPERMAGSLPTEAFLDGRAFDLANPPNAAIVADTPDGQDILVVELLNPMFDAGTGTVSYQAQPLTGDPSPTLASLLALQQAESLEPSLGPVTLFIDELACGPDGSSCTENSRCCSGFCCIDIEVCPPWVCTPT